MGLIEVGEKLRRLFDELKTRQLIPGSSYRNPVHVIKVAFHFPVLAISKGHSPRFAHIHRSEPAGPRVNVAKKIVVNGLEVGSIEGRVNGGEPQVKFDATGTHREEFLVLE